MAIERKEKQAQHGKRIAHEHFAPSDPYQLMVEHFAAVLAQEVPIAYPPQEAIQALVVLDEIRLHWKRARRLLARLQATSRLVIQWAWLI